MSSGNTEKNAAIGWQQVVLQATKRDTHTTDGSKPANFKSGEKRSYVGNMARHAEDKSQDGPRIV